MKPTLKKTAKTEQGKKTVGKLAAPPIVVARDSSVGSPAPKAVTMQTPAPKPGRITLELVNTQASRVLVAGSFNGWKPETTPLRPLGNGRWAGNLEVEPGKYEYLFVVDGNWMPDPSATESVANPFGGRNSVLTV
jgi:hypothetical protein